MFTDHSRRSPATMTTPKEAPGDPPTGESKPASPTWVSVAQKKGLRKYDVEVTDQNGQKSVEVPSEVSENASSLWEDFILGNFLDTTPHVAKVHVILNKIWSFGDKSQKIDVIEVDSKTIKPLDLRWTVW